MLDAAPPPPASVPARVGRVLVDSLRLRDFRSYAHEEISLTQGLTVLVGPNGAGKTNLLEAAHMAVQGFPLRTRRDVATIRTGADTARVTATGLRGAESRYEAQVTIERSGGKRIVLDGAPAAGLDDLRRAFPVLAFTPDRLAVVKGGPLVRRTYLDRTLGRVLPSQATLPADYATAVSQRNAALRRTHVGLSTPDAVAPWTAAVVSLGTELDQQRARLVELLGERAEARAALLGLAGMALRYVPSAVSTDILERLLARDLERGTTGAGPHLAELELAADGRDLRALGSQGEQRLAVLALLLAEAECLIESRGDPPMLLLDDVLSELDDRRREALLCGIPPDCQTLVTTTSLRMLPTTGPDPDAVVDVSPGRADVR